ncbi:aldehyde dehydrogenase family protein [Streptomyces sp. ME19-01-6]|uniref:aldehyde dehydrogenase family protein n=1 Tax=Streptomyces sp. ME19-01-6 TaxID=3028686 RepID=UPI0029ABE735|nr:aldehyde dehydrogenase family protein [Streptomyces sp. ME19-01-6]MDX3225043.1 aldehyde dehydrogenase family protein [Streptomyces sp. ME19-01-6]
MSTAAGPTTATVRRAADAPPLITAADLPPARHLIDGKFLDGSPGRVIDVVDPSTENVIARIPEGTAEDIDRAVAAAAAAKGQWARLVPKERSELLHAIADRLAENTELLSKLESANTGKPLAVSRDDVGMTIDTFRFMAGALRATTSMAAGDYAENHLSVILREPLGVIREW